MNPLQTYPLTRQQIAEFIPSDRGVRAFEGAQTDIHATRGGLTDTQFLTLAAGGLGAERVLTPVAGELTGTDGTGDYTLGLADTAVAAGTYGNPAGFVTLTVDAKGRATGVTTFALTASSGIAYDNTTGAFTAVKAGTYGAPTGTLSRATFASYTAPTVSVIYTQAEVQAIANALQAVSRTLAALITDLRANGNLA